MTKNLLKHIDHNNNIEYKNKFPIRISFVFS